MVFLASCAHHPNAFPLERSCTGHILQAEHCGRSPVQAGGYIQLKPEIPAKYRQYRGDAFPAKGRYLRKDDLSNR
jgi:hypothetical protein